MNYSSFYIEKNIVIDNSDFKNVRTLYSPIIGATASSLFFALLDEYDLNINDKRYKYKISDFINTLNINQNDFNLAKEKLEAVGLIQYYEADLYDAGLIQIKKPMDIKNFSQSLLSKHLIEKIGEERYNKIQHRSDFYQFDKSQYKNLSKNFFDIFEESNISTSELNRINYENTVNMTVTSIEELIKIATPTDYCESLTNRSISPSQLKMINDLLSMGFNNYSINLFINFSWQKNNQIVVAYIEKIAMDYKMRKITNPEAIKRELESSLSIKKTLNEGLGGFSTTTPEFKIKTEEPEDIFKKYGIEDWDV
ncbi:DnaD domain protein [[Mycoplasma] gypis]|uniref:DnaD domain protein n=1 Tax=[Mycoplasma] gypis TaxID=92404 RepID=A0ABZ2RW10_9BACT|nr:DnaD domain protein [[Mycoplasma] gypis]MBN0919637.1 DnaD domain protein [[Mycoplasma] gypis]